MTEQRVTSRKNPQLVQLKKLFASRSDRETLGLFAGDGVKLLAEAIAHGAQLDTVVLSDGVEMDIPEGVRVLRVPQDVMESVSPMAAPQGAVFSCRMPKREALVPQGGCLLLDGVQDPGNLGTIVRTADAFRVPVVLLEGCADCYNHKVVRATMGAVFRTPVYTSTWAEAKEAFQQAGVPIAVTALRDNARDIRTAPLDKMAVVIGSEGRGVRPEILNSAQETLIIPMNPHCESLNAAVAAAVVMWQMGKYDIS